MGHRGQCDLGREPTDTPMAPQMISRARKPATSSALSPNSVNTATVSCPGSGGPYAAHWSVDST